MAMKQCPVCGEKYSDTYKNCPFCEEEEALREGDQIRRSSGRGGKRAARNRQPNLLSPILIVLILIMAGLLVYLLFGDKIADRLAPADDAQTPPVEDVTPDEPDTPAQEDPDAPDGGDGTMPEDGESAGGGTPEEPDAPADPAEETAPPAAITIT